MDPFQVVQLVSSLAAYADDAVPSRASTLFAKTAAFGSGGLGSGSNSPNQQGTPTSGKGTIECLDLSELSLLLGTSDGYVLHYVLDVAAEVGSRASADEVVSQLINKKLASSTRKAIEGIAIVPKQDKVVAMTDSTLIFLSLQTLQPLSVTSFQPVRAITAFSVDLANETAPAFRLSTAKRRTLQCLRIGPDNLLLEKEVPLGDGAVALCRYNQVVCAADSQTYKLVRLADGETIPLFPYERTVSRPLICPVGKGEFLLVMTSNQHMGLGVFVNARGDAVRGTLQWPSVPKSVAFHFPYIVTLLKNSTIEIHNLFSQELIQTIPIPPSMDPRFLSLSTGEFKLPAPRSLTATDPNATPVSASAVSCKVRVIMRCRDMVIGLKMRPMQDQLRSMLDAGQVDRAIKMGEDMVNSDPAFFNNDKLRALYRTAGLMHLRDSLFDDSFQMFQRGHVNPLGLIALFPSLTGDRLTAVLGSTTMMQTVQDMKALGKDIDELVKAGLERNYPNADEDTMTSFSTALVANAKEMLYKYLNYSSVQKDWKPYVKEIRTVQFKLLCESNQTDQIRKFFASPDPVYVDECQLAAVIHARQYALALLYKFEKKPEEALRLWQLEAENHETAFDNMEEVVELLQTIEDKGAFSTYLVKTIERDPSVILKLFNGHCKMLLEMDLDEMSKILSPLGPAVQVLYLEHLSRAGGEREQDPDIHASLANLYMEQLLDQKSADILERLDEEYRESENKLTFPDYLAACAESEPLCGIRKSLLRLLMGNQSPAVVQAVTAKVQPLIAGHEGLQFEKAILAASKREHEAVLRLLGTGIRDFESAEHYCFMSEIPNPWVASRAPTQADEEAAPGMLLCLLTLYLDDKDG
ncbi:transforming growth factor, beta receptor associated protein 1 [Phlyctochytrium bullatum]|nr:transforming growth factor, beta receptor associated protein 1 [Phlyctochytrium bullatum]